MNSKFRSSKFPRCHIRDARKKVLKGDMSPDSEELAKLIKTYKKHIMALETKKGRKNPSDGSLRGKNKFTQLVHQIRNRPAAHNAKPPLTRQQSAAKLKKCLEIAEDLRDYGEYDATYWEGRKIRGRYKKIQQGRLTT